MKEEDAKTFLDGEHIRIVCADDSKMPHEMTFVVLKAFAGHRYMSRSDLLPLIERKVIKQVGAKKDCGYCSIYKY